MIFGPLVMIINIAFVVFFVILVFRWLGSKDYMPQPHTGKTELDILDERFAQGEIEKDEYEERKQTLST